MTGSWRKWGVCGECKTPRMLRAANSFTCCGERRSSSTRVVWRFTPKFRYLESGK